MRGEYYCWSKSTPRIWELPPRARRIRVYADPETGLTGTTSACAENTRPCRTFRMLGRNYLRVRGEYLRSPRWRVLPWELPPRARRIRHKPYRLTAEQGTTSACAENTKHPHDLGETQRNYLRVRGEYSISALFEPTPAELPPRARRILAASKTIEGMPGTTSACAENTFNQQISIIRAGNYLRVRGEYSATPELIKRAAELPPRARRIPLRLSKLPATVGTTSACAENTRRGL